MSKLYLYDDELLKRVLEIILFGIKFNTSYDPIVRSRKSVGKLN